MLHYFCETLDYAIPLLFLFSAYISLLCFHFSISDHALMKGSRIVRKRSAYIIFRMLLCK